MWFEAAGEEDVVEDLETVDDGLGGAVFEGLGQDCVAVVIVYDKEVIVST